MKKWLKDLKRSTKVTIVIGAIAAIGRMDTGCN